MSIKKKQQTEEEIWQEVNDYMKNAPVPFQYKTEFMHNAYQVGMMIDMDPGGGFESGVEFTSLSAAVPIQFTSLKATVSRLDTFRFALHDEGVMDRVGKFFGLEDIIIGYPEFDKQLIVKTNDPAKLKKLFADITVRNTFQSLKEFSFQIINDQNNNQDCVIEFMIDRAITDIRELKKIYEAYAKVLDNLNI